MNSQAHLDTAQLATAIETELQALRVQPAAADLDFTNVDNLIANAQAVASCLGGDADAPVDPDENQ